MNARPAAATITDAAAFIRANTRLHAPRLVPEILLHQADALYPLWHATEPDLDALGLPPPYWAFAWAGGQALARYLLDRPAVAAGKRVLDFGAGSGLVAIAAMQAGAVQVLAADIDAFARAAIALNAAANGVAVDITGDDLIGGDAPFDIICAGDVCYEQPMAGRVMHWLRQRAAAGTLVLIGDPRRAYLPEDGLDAVARYGVATTTEIEDSDLRNAIVWRVAAV